MPVEIVTLMFIIYVWSQLTSGDVDENWNGNTVFVTPTGKEILIEFMEVVPLAIGVTDGADASSFSYPLHTKVKAVGKSFLQL